MNKTSRMFMGVAVAALLLLSCNDTGLNTSGGDDNPALKGGVDGTKQPDNSPPYDSTIVIIADDVQKWLAEQLASKGSEKKLINISDTYLPDTYSEAGLSATSDPNGKVKYFQNGKEISAEKYNSILEEKRRLPQNCRRNLSIPGEILSGENNCINWIAQMTATELNELLSKKYDNIAISFYIEPTDD